MPTPHPRPHPHLQRDVGPADGAGGEARELVHLDLRQGALQRLGSPGSSSGGGGGGSGVELRGREGAGLGGVSGHGAPQGRARGCIPRAGSGTAATKLELLYSLALLLGHDSVHQLPRCRTPRHRPLLRLLGRALLIKQRRHPRLLHVAKLGDLHRAGRR